MAADRRFMLGPESLTCGRKCGCRQKVYVRSRLVGESVVADRMFVLGPDSLTCGRKCRCRQNVCVRPRLIDLWEKVWLQTEGLC